MKSNGDSMQRLHCFHSILVFTAFLIGCAPKAAAQPEQVKALENHTTTNLPDHAASTPVGTSTSELVPHDSPLSCPITVPQNPPFVPPTPYDSMDYESEFWYGSTSLWTAKNGI